MGHARRRGARGVGRPLPRRRWRRRGSTIAAGRREGPVPRAWVIRTTSSQPPTRRWPRSPGRVRRPDARHVPRRGGCARRRARCGADASAGHERHRPGAGGAPRRRGARRVRAPAATYRRMARGNQSLPDAIADSLPDVRLGHRVRSRHVTARRGRGPGGGRCRAVRRRRRGGAPGARGVGDAVLPRSAGRPRDALVELPMGAASKLAVAVEGAPDTSRRAERGAAVLVLDGERR